MRSSTPSCLNTCALLGLPGGLLATGDTTYGSLWSHVGLSEEGTSTLSLLVQVAPPLPGAASVFLRGGLKQI